MDMPETFLMENLTWSAQIMKGVLYVLILYVLAQPSVCLAEIDNMKSMGHGDVRYLGLIKIYEATLYAQASLDNETILDTNISKCLQLEYAISLSTDDFILGANTILARQQSVKKLSQLQPEIDLLHRAYQDVKEGDNYLLCYKAEDFTTTLALNGRNLVTITSADFGSVYFGIWLNPVAPIDQTLRDNLLKYRGSNFPGGDKNEKISRNLSKYNS